MTLKIGTTPHSQWRVLTPLLVNLGWENADDADPETWYQHAEVSPESTHLLLHTRPEVAVAHAIDAGQKPEDALETWRSSAEQMLAFYKHNRATTAMVEVCDAVRNPQACITALKQHLGLKIQDDLPELSHLEQSPSVNQLLANQLIAQKKELSNLLAEVEACTLPLGTSGFRSLRVEMLELYRQLREAKPEQAQQQEDCERLLAALTQLEEGYESEQRGHLKTKSVLDETREENDLILSQLFKVQEELERYYLEGKKKDEELKKNKTAITGKNTKLKKISAEKRRLQAQVDTLENRLTQLHRSVSWKLTAPVRLLAKPFGRSNRARFKKEAKLIAQSEFFDANWYLAQYSDVAQSKLSPADHYVRYGATEHRDPSSKFSTKQYLKAYEDVAHSGVNPLVHYLLFGKTEGRSPAPTKK